MKDSRLVFSHKIGGIERAFFWLRGIDPTIIGNLPTEQYQALLKETSNPHLLKTQAQNTQYLKAPSFQESQLLSFTEIMNIPNLALAQHSLISDIFVAPLGRVSGLQSQMAGLSAITYSHKLDADHDREALMSDLIRVLESPEMGTGLWSIKVRNILETNCDQSLNYQLAAMGTATGDYKNSSSEQLIAYIRFNDNGRKDDNVIRMAAFDKRVIDLVKPVMSKYSPIKSFHITTLGVTGKELNVRTEPVKEADAIIHDEFYPFIEEGANSLIEDFYADDASVMILTGVQGSGKSSLYRGMLSHNTEGKFFQVIDSSIYRDPDKLSIMMNRLSDQALTSQVTVALEEIDAFVKEKDLDNALLPRLLAMSSGIVKANIKFVALANVPNSGQYHEALTRDGRTFRCIDFRELTPAEAAVARKAVNLEPMLFDKPQTLATVLRSRTPKPRKVKRSMGFISGTE